MSLRELVLADLELAIGIVRDGREVVPAWRILTPEGDFTILTRFDHDKPEQRAHVRAGAKVHGLEARQRLHPHGGDMAWPGAHAVRRGSRHGNRRDFRLLPAGASEVTAEEAAELAAFFGENGEAPARPVR
jgi:hypothetical protein